MPSTGQRAGVGKVQRGDGPHERRLAGAVGPEDRGHPAALGHEIEPVEGTDRLVPLAEALDQAGGLDDRWIGVVHGRKRPNGEGVIRRGLGGRETQSHESMMNGKHGHLVSTFGAKIVRCVLIDWSPPCSSCSPVVG